MKHVVIIKDKARPAACANSDAGNGVQRFISFGWQVQYLTMDSLSVRS